MQDTIRNCYKKLQSLYRNRKNLKGTENFLRQNILYRKLKIKAQIIYKLRTKMFSASKNVKTQPFSSKRL